MISPTQRTLFQSLTSIFKRTMARGWGGGRVNCGRVHAIFNQEITPSEPHPILILFDLLHCYKKLIHAVGDHHRPRKNARSLRTLRLWPMLMSTAWQSHSMPKNPARTIACQKGLEGWGWGGYQKRTLPCWRIFLIFADQIFQKVGGIKIILAPSFAHFCPPFLSLQVAKFFQGKPKNFTAH